MASPVSEIKRSNDVPEKIGKYVITAAKAKLPDPVWPEQIADFRVELRTGVWTSVPVRDAVYNFSLDTRSKRRPPPGPSSFIHSADAMLW